MRDRLIDALVRGDVSRWAAIGVLWALATLVVLVHRPGRRPPRAAPFRTAWTWILLAAATATSLAGLPLSAAIAVPRLRWVAVDAPDLVAQNPGTWRKLRGPGVAIAGPDVAVPTIDAGGRWVLYGLLSGKPVPGLPAAEPAPLEPGAPRLCRIEGTACRPWPVAWPDPTRPLAQADLSWAPAGGRPLGGSAPFRIDDALAFDVESGLYLRHIEPAPLRAPVSGKILDGPHLEITGRVAADEPHEGSSVLFVVRKVVKGRLTEVRLAAMPAPRGGLGHVFQLQRAGASLTAGPRVYAYVVRPVLLLTSLSLPLGGVVILLERLLRRRRDAASWVAPALEAVAALSAGVAVAGPAVVAMASLWGSR